MQTEATMTSTAPEGGTIGIEQMGEARPQSGETIPEKLTKLAKGELGQGTTEYAILVGVLVVIAILAIVAFRGKVQELWDAITSGINSL